MFLSKVINKLPSYLCLSKSSSNLKINDVKVLSKSLTFTSNKTYSTTVPIDDDIFGFTDDQKQVILKCYF